MELQMPVSPEQGPQACFLGETHPRYGEPRPLRFPGLIPGRAAFKNRDVTGSDIALHAHLIPESGGHPFSAPAAGAGNIELGQSGRNHTHDDLRSSTEWARFKPGRSKQVNGDQFQAHGTAQRIGGAYFLQVRTLEKFNHQPSLRRDILAHFSTTTWIGKAENLVLLGPPGVGKTHLAIGLGVKAPQAGFPVLFDTATNWTSRLTTANNSGRLAQELKRLRRYRLLVIDEIGYLAFDHDAANLFFQLVAARYEQGSLLATSNMPFGGARSSPTTSLQPQ